MLVRKDRGRLVRYAAADGVIRIMGDTLVRSPIKASGSRNERNDRLAGSWSQRASCNAYGGLSPANPMHGERLIRASPSIPIPERRHGKRQTGPATAGRSLTSANVLALRQWPHNPPPSGSAW